MDLESASLTSTPSKYSNVVHVNFAWKRDGAA